MPLIKDGFAKGDRAFHVVDPAMASFTKPAPKRADESTVT
jgi:hypothetical protein